MLRLFVPLILLGAAAGLFFLYIDPTYQNIKDVKAQQMEYDQALTKSQELLALRNSLIARRNTFSPDDVHKLERVLPDNVDNIRLILDTETIAQRYQLHVQNIGIKSPQAGRSDRSALAVGDTGDPLGSVNLSFTVSSKYSDFVRFLQDLERSVRVVDIENISFSVGGGIAGSADVSEYAISLRTYWLR